MDPIKINVKTAMYKCTVERKRKWSSNGSRELERPEPVRECTISLPTTGKTFEAWGEY